MLKLEPLLELHKKYNIKEGVSDIIEVKNILKNTHLVEDIDVEKIADKYKNEVTSIVDDYDWMFE
jgi:hypothetical protein